MAKNRASNDILSSLQYVATLKFVARIPGRHFLRNLVERRALVAQLVRRDFRARYVGSSAGWLWGVVHPIVQLLIWIIVFKYWIGATLGPDEVTTNYPLFLLSLIHISEPTRLLSISYAVFCLKK